MKRLLCNSLVVMYIFNSFLEISTNFTFNYYIRSNWLNSYNISHSSNKKFKQGFMHYMKDPILTYIQKGGSKLVPRNNLDSPGNLHSIIENFAKERCFIAINNFEGVDITPAHLTPLLLRRFDLAVVDGYLANPNGRKQITIKDLVWTTKEAIMYISGNFSINKRSKPNIKKLEHNCPISRFYSAFRLAKSNAAFCVALEGNLFAFAIKPWQCQVQIDLFMPDRTFELGKYTQIFRYIDNLDSGSIPSSRPHINMLISLRESVEKYQNLALLAWMARRNLRFVSDSSTYLAVADILIIGYVVICQNKNMLCCNIEKVNILVPSFEHSNWYYERTLSITNISLESILLVDKFRENELILGSLKSIVNLRYLSLPDQIAYFASEEKVSLKYALNDFANLKNKYQDSLQMLAFANASIVIDFLGNATENVPSRISDLPALSGEYIDLFFERSISVYDFPYESKHNILQLENKFMSLKFVSCSSKGTDGFNLLGLVSVFETNVWKWIMITVTVFAFSIVHITGRTWKILSSSGIWYITKLFLEQGDPFPVNLVNVKRLRFVISGTLLAGLVLSNAFKSTNVYNVVTPRRQIPFQYMSELLENNYTVYSRLERFHFWIVTLKNFDLEFSYVSDSFSVDLKQFHGLTEAYLNWKQLKRIVRVYKHEKMAYISMLNKTILHPSTENLIRETFDIIKPLVKVGRLTFESLYRLSAKHLLEKRFWKEQNQFIMSDLIKCEKSAWILPEYSAQIYSRNLRNLDKHSDVGISSYSNPYLTFIFHGLVPVSLLKKFFMVMSSGLFEWWPNFINRTDIKIHHSLRSPKPPNMAGNIQLIFKIFGTGLAVGLCSMILELRKKILSVLKLVCRKVLRLWQILRVHITACTKYVFLHKRERSKRPKKRLRRIYM